MIAASREASSPVRPLRLSPLLLSILMVAVVPSIVWVALDRTAWPWDQAWYGKYSVILFYTLRYAPTEWLPAMLGVFGRMAPGIAWVGQFFVPLGVLLGSIDVGLLLSVVFAQAIALLLVARACWDFSQGRTWVAATAVIVMAAAPLFIALSHYYLVEMMQTMGVCWFILIMTRAPRWPRLEILAQLELATTWAMLAKVSSPLFCIGPGLVACYYLVWPGTSDGVSPRRAALTLGIGIPLGAATAIWYSRNLHAVVAHVSMASTGSVAELYGKSLPFFSSLTDWLYAVQVNCFSPMTAIAAIAVIAAAVIAAFAKGTRDTRFLVVAIVAFLQILVALSVFSLSSNREPRYMLPLLPYMALVMCWAVAQLGRRWIGLVLCAVFTLQWVQAQAQAFHLTSARVQTSAWLNPVMTNASGQRTLDSIVRRTCAEKTAETYSNTVGAQLLWLNPPALSYAATKAYAPAHALHCDYDAVGYFDKDVDAAWRGVLARKTLYYVAIDPSSATIPSTAVGQTINGLSEPVRKRLETSGLFQAESPIAAHPGILIFKRVDQIDHVVSGRALSDRGRHDQAIDELTLATRQDPTNVEAWANLALACERAGRMEQAIAAGEKARLLNPRHYYVNVGLARVLFAEKNWPGSIRRAEDAAADAPGAGERTAALAIAATGWFRSGDARHGCDVLARAATVQPTNADIVRELADHACVR